MAKSQTLQGPRQKQQFGRSLGQNRLLISESLPERHVVSGAHWGPRCWLQSLFYHKDTAVGNHNFGIFYLAYQSFPVVSGKETACQCRRRGSDPWDRQIPWRRKWQPVLATPVFLPGKSHGQRSLHGCSPQAHRKVRYNTGTINKTAASSLLMPDPLYPPRDQHQSWDNPGQEANLAETQLYPAGQASTSLWTPGTPRPTIRISPTHHQSDTSSRNPRALQPEIPGSSSAHHSAGEFTPAPKHPGPHSHQCKEQVLTTSRQHQPQATAPPTGRPALAPRPQAPPDTPGPSVNSNAHINMKNTILCALLGSRGIEDKMSEILS